MQNLGVQSSLRQQRRIQQLEEQLKLSEKSRGDLAELLQKRAATGAIFREDTVQQEKMNELLTVISKKDAEIQLLRRQNKTLEHQNQSLGQQLIEHRSALLTEHEMVLKLQKFALLTNQFKTELSQEKLLNEQLIDVQQQIVEENETLKLVIEDLRGKQREADTLEPEIDENLSGQVKQVNKIKNDVKSDFQIENLQTNLIQNGVIKAGSKTAPKSQEILFQSQDSQRPDVQLSQLQRSVFGELAAQMETMRSGADE